MRALREDLPAALPVRYGAREGLVAFDWDERFLFRDQALEKSVVWQACTPFYGGLLVGLRSALRREGPPYVSMDVTLDAREYAVLDFKRHFLKSVVRVAAEVESFYAFAVLERNLGLYDGALTGSHRSVIPRPKVMDGDRWLGLPLGEFVFEWFGPSYVPLVGDEVRGLGRAVGGGLLVEWEDEAHRLAAIPPDLLAPLAEDRPADIVPADV